MREENGVFAFVVFVEEAEERKRKGIAFQQQGLSKKKYLLVIPVFFLSSLPVVRTKI
jgi:hypothetical protein